MSRVLIIYSFLFCMTLKKVDGAYIIGTPTGDIKVWRLRYAFKLLAQLAGQRLAPVKASKKA